MPTFSIYARPVALALLALLAWWWQRYEIRQGGNHVMDGV